MSSRSRKTFDVWFIVIGCDSVVPHVEVRSGKNVSNAYLRDVASTVVDTKELVCVMFGDAVLLLDSVERGGLDTIVDGSNEGRGPATTRFMALAQSRSW